MFNYPDGLFAAETHFVFSEDWPQGTEREVSCQSEKLLMSFKITFSYEQEYRVLERFTACRIQKTKRFLVNPRSCQLSLRISFNLKQECDDIHVIHRVPRFTNKNFCILSLTSFRCQFNLEHFIQMTAPKHNFQSQSGGNEFINIEKYKVQSKISEE